MIDGASRARAYAKRTAAATGDLQRNAVLFIGHPRSTPRARQHPGSAALLLQLHQARGSLLAAALVRGQVAPGARRLAARAAAAPPAHVLPRREAIALDLLHAASLHVVDRDHDAPGLRERERHPRRATEGIR